MNLSNTEAFSSQLLTFSDIPPSLNYINTHLKAPDHQNIIAADDHFIKGWWLNPMEVVTGS